MPVREPLARRSLPETETSPQEVLSVVYGGVVLSLIPLEEHGGRVSCAVYVGREHQLRRAGSISIDAGDYDQMTEAAPEWERLADNGTDNPIRFIWGG